MIKPEAVTIHYFSSGTKALAVGKAELEQSDLVILTRKMDDEKSEKDGFTREAVGKLLAERPPQKPLDGYGTMDEVCNHYERLMAMKG